MLITHLILAALASGALARWPSRAISTCVVAVAAAAAVLLGAPVAPALGVAAPLFAFLAAALTLAALVERSGLAGRAAATLAKHARGNALLLYGLVCALCLVLTAVVSLDGAIVLMVPLVLALNRRWSVPLAPLFVGVVAVANAGSIAVPQGNPTNLVVIDRLGLSPGTFLVHMLVPGLAAATLCAVAVAICERAALALPYHAPNEGRTALSREERYAALALLAAGLAAWTAPLIGVAPWWPFTGVVAIALAARRRQPRVVLPWRIAIQVTGLVIVLGALAVHAPAHVDGGLAVDLAVAAGAGAASSLANNLPISVCAAAVLAGPWAYAATVGLAVGSLATPHGSVATLIARDLAGPLAPAHPTRRFAALAAGALAAATFLLWAIP
jgi:arsenical pump membrane protein